jgi:acyl-coenzyme A thioesterase PaaI-like protein
MEKQPSSKMCFVCGRENPIGFHLHFFQDESGCVYADYVPKDEHQGFPGVMHGGLISTLLDEIIGRTAIANNIWCMTAELDIRYKKPVPIGSPLKLKGSITQQKGRLIHGKAEMMLDDGSVAAEAHGTYLKISEQQMESYKSALEWWKVDE